MNKTNLEVFIQNLKDTTTVLQQLNLCIDEIKKSSGYMCYHNIFIDDVKSDDNIEVYWRFVIPSRKSDKFTTIKEVIDALKEVYGTNIINCECYSIYNNTTINFLNRVRVTNDNKLEGKYISGNTTYTVKLGDNTTVTDNNKII